MRNDYTLFFRVVPSGKKVVYYYAYDDDGNRIGPWTTGQLNKTLARNFCNDLLRKGTLVPGIKGMTTFDVYAKEFWDWEKSEYLKHRRKRRNLTQGYAEKCQKQTDFTLVPYYGSMRMDKITGEVIDKWLDYMIANDYEHSTINGYYGTLMTMMKWAAKKKYIIRDPFLDVQRLVEEQKEKKLVTREEFNKLFGKDWKKAWNKDLLLCTANKLAALTGMRVSEIIALKGNCIHNTHIYVASQYKPNIGEDKTKGKTKDNVPLTPEMIKDLRKLENKSGNGYLFSLTGGKTPVTIRHIYNGLRRAFKNIGISEDEIKERGLNVHAWRHFANTEMLKNGISLKKVQAVIRHKTSKITDRYTHFDPLEFTDVVNVQAGLLKKKTGKKKPEQVKQEQAVQEYPALQLVKSPDVKDTGTKKRAS